MTEKKYPKWHPLFLKAILAPIDSPQLPQIIKEAEVAISQRLQELRVSSNGNQERQDIGEALPSLRYVRSQNFGHSAIYGPQQRGAD